MPLSQENRMQMAISAYKSRKIRTQTKAAEIYGVSRTTLQGRLRGINPRSANGHKLQAIEEDTLLKRLLEADKRRLPIRPEVLCGMAQILLRNRLQDPTAALNIN
jgi:hypothetical protein